jgi:hypothetical protein
MRWSLTPLAVILAACSLVNDPGTHMGNPPPVPDAGSMDGSDGVDAGADAGMPRDGGGDAGSDDAGPTDAGPPPPIPAADLCGELVAAICEMRIGCCTSAMGEDFDDCRANYSTRCATSLGAAANDGRTGYDPVVAGAVLAELRALTATCNLEIIDFLSDSNGFLRMFEGTFPMGAGCNAWSIELYACAAGNVCRGVVFFWSCQPRVLADAECREDYNCIDGYFCDEARTTTMGTGLCTPRRADSEPCARNTQCQSLVCSETTCQARTDELFCVDPFSSG